jgi:hypothetical protein
LPVAVNALDLTQVPRPLAGVLAHFESLDNLMEVVAVELAP